MGIGGITFDMEMTLYVNEFSEDKSYIFNLNNELVSIDVSANTRQFVGTNKNFNL